MMSILLGSLYSGVEQEVARNAFSRVWPRKGESGVEKGSIGFALPFARIILLSFLKTSLNRVMWNMLEKSEVNM
jgi:hypothetical protein